MNLRLYFDQLYKKLNYYRSNFKQKNFLRKKTIINFYFYNIIFKKLKKTEKFSVIYQEIEIQKLIRSLKIAKEVERNILVKN